MHRIALISLLSAALLSTAAFGGSGPPSVPASRAPKAKSAHAAASKAPGVVFGNALSAPPGAPAFEKVGAARISADLLRPASGEFRLGPGDKIEVEIMEITNTRQVCQLMPDGTVFYHTLASVKAEGMTVPELKTALEDGLKDLYRTPQVSIILRGVSSQRVWLMGRVNTPGLYPLDKPMTVIEAISRAGGLFSSRFSGTTEELADLKHSFLVRDGEFLPVDFYKLLKEGDLSQNVYLRNGDYVYLPSALSQEVYVLGAVKQPQALGFGDQVTLVSAITSARGVLPGGHAQRIVIIRGSLSQPEVATVNLKDILAGKAPDIALQPRDIVWVPNSPWGRIGEFTKSIINTFTRTIAANEGGRAVSATSQPVQTNISINAAPTP